MLETINYINAFNNCVTNGATPPMNVKTAIAIDISIPPFETFSFAIFALSYTIDGAFVICNFAYLHSTLFELYEKQASSSWVKPTFCYEII